MKVSVIYQIDTTIADSIGRRTFHDFKWKKFFFFLIIVVHPVAGSFSWYFFSLIIYFFVNNYVTCCIQPFCLKLFL